MTASSSSTAERQAGGSSSDRPRRLPQARLSVLGASLDVGNRGVRALGMSVAELLAQTCPGAEIVFHYGNATGGSRWLKCPSGNIEISVENCRMSPASAL